MRHFILLIFPFILLFGNEHIHAELQYKKNLHTEEVAALEDFFKVLCMESEGGYVLYGKKPVCINGFFVQDDFGGPSEAHRNAVCLKEGASIWKQIRQKNEGNLIIHIYDQPDSLAKNHIHILFVNKELFCKTVQENLSLFQYVLGPNLTPETLLESLIDPTQTFHSVLKEDKVLIGILLGFGTQNALHGSRIENLQEAYIKGGENIPLKNPLKDLDSFMGHYKYVFLTQLNINGKVASLKPSFSYKTLEDEITNGLEMIELSSTKLTQNKPHFVFGKLKNSKENDRLIAELESTQEDIIKLFSAGDFLKKSLKTISPNLEIVFEENSHRILEKNPLLNAVSLNIYDTVRDENEIYFDGFIKGLQDADKQKKSDRINSTGHFDKLKVLTVAKKNVEEADRLLSDLEINGYTSVEKGKIVFKTSKQGNGKVLDEQGIVQANYRIKMPNGEVLKDTWADKEPDLINLNDAIQGFAWGMKGMQEGETREIVIHPSAAYGLYTNLDKGIHLVAEVELLSIEPTETPTPFSPIEYLDFSAPFNFLSQNNFDEITRNEGYLLGYAIGSHYKKQTYFTLNELIEAIQKIAQSDEIPEYQDSDLVNKLHWQIYHQEST